MQQVNYAAGSSSLVQPEAASPEPEKKVDVTALMKSDPRLVCSNLLALQAQAMGRYEYIPGGPSSAVHLLNADLWPYLCRFIARLIQQLDAQMRAMSDEKKQRQEQIEEDAKEMARLDADINAHIKPKLVRAQPWPQPCRMSEPGGQAADRCSNNLPSILGFRMRASSSSSASALQGSQ